MGKNLRARMVDSDTCFHCASPFLSEADKTIDHFIPKSKGGACGVYNCVFSCSRCNGVSSNYMKAIPLEFDIYCIESKHNGKGLLVLRLCEGVYFSINGKEVQENLVPYISKVEYKKVKNKDSNDTKDNSLL